MICRSDPIVLKQIKSLVAPALEGAREKRAERLERLGFAIQKTQDKRVLVTLPHGVPVMELGASTRPNSA